MSLTTVVQFNKVRQEKFMSPILSIITAAFLVSLISFSGAFILVSGRLVTKRTSYLLSFAAGTMLAVSFLDLLPEALKTSAGSNIFEPAFFGVVVFFFLERFVLWFHHHDEMHGLKPPAILILVGDGFHNFIDGVGIAAAFLTDPSLGILTTLAIAAHEIPQEIADFSVLVHSGMKKMTALFYNFVSGLTALVGALGAIYFLKDLQQLLPLSLAFTAGMFIYIACSDLIPEIHRDSERQKGWVHFLPFLIGVGMLWFLVKVLQG